MKLIFVLILTVFSLNNVHAQAHDLSPNSNCKLHKKGFRFDSEGKQPCPACMKKHDEEIAARQAEDQKRNEAIWAKAKAKKEASDKAWKEKQVADAEKADAGKVLINGNQNNVPNNTIVSINTKTLDGEAVYKAVTAPVDTYDRLMYGTSPHHIAIFRNDQITFESNEFNEIEGPFLFNKKPYFRLSFVSEASPCKAFYLENRSILIDELGKKIDLPNINKFFAFKYLDENRFFVSVLTGECLQKPEWEGRPNSEYLFYFDSMKVYNTNNGTYDSWHIYSNCNCSDMK